jgi:hypothetical protein
LFALYEHPWTRKNARPAFPPPSIALKPLLLPVSLKRKLIHGKAASECHCEQKDIAELEDLFRLEDPRGR